MRTKAGRVKAHRRLERRAAARRGVESTVAGKAEAGAAAPASPDAVAEGVRDLGARRSPEADEALASRAETATSDRITRDVRKRVDGGAALEADAQRVPVEAAGAEGGLTVHRQRADAHDEAELGAEAFLDNDYVPGELDAPAERPAHVRAPHDEADFDAESEDAAARQARRERRSGDEEAKGVQRAGNGRARRRGHGGAWPAWPPARPTMPPRVWSACGARASRALAKTSEGRANERHSRPIHLGEHDDSCCRAWA